MEEMDKIRKSSMIGNYVKCQNLCPAIITGITYSFCYYDFGGKSHECTWDQCKPIPLTEKWLIKFGFKKKKLYNDFWFELNVRKWHFITNDSQYYKNKNKWFIGFEEKIGYDSYNFVKDCNTVHQLQNLYFALTGKELCQQ